MFIYFWIPNSDITRSDTDIQFLLIQCPSIIIFEFSFGSGILDLDQFLDPSKIPSPTKFDFNFFPLKVH